MTATPAAMRRLRQRSMPTWIAASSRSRRRPSARSSPPGWTERSRRGIRPPSASTATRRPRRSACRSGSSFRPTSGRNSATRSAHRSMPVRATLSRPSVSRKTAAGSTSCSMLSAITSTTGETIGIMKITRDLTPLKAAEDKFRLAVEILPERDDDERPRRHDRDGQQGDRTAVRLPREELIGRSIEDARARTAARPPHASARRLRPQPEAAPHGRQPRDDQERARTAPRSRSRWASRRSRAPRA